MIRLAAILILLATPALAAPMKCATTDVVTRGLAAKYQEYRIMAGLVDNGTHMVVLYENPKTGTWTLAAQYPNGLSCFIQSGKDGLVRLVPKKGRGT